MPNGCADSDMPWGKRHKDNLRNKTLFGKGGLQQMTLFVHRHTGVTCGRGECFRFHSMETRILPYILDVTSSRKTL